MVFRYVQSDSSYRRAVKTPPLQKIMASSESFFFNLLVIPNGNVYAFFSLYHNCTFMLAFCVQPIFALIGSSSLYAFLLSEVGFLCVCVLQGKSLQLQMQFQVFCLAAWKRAGLILARAALGCKGLSP